MSFSVPPWQAFTTNFLLAPGVRLGLLHAIFALLTITDPAVFFARRLPLPSHPDRRSAMSLRGRALTDADDALLPLPRLLPDQPAWEGEAAGAAVAVRGVDLDC